MTGGTSNIVRIFGSRYADYGISSNGPDRDVFSEAPCVDRWDLYDQDNPSAEDIDLMRGKCATCPALDLCKQGENVTSVYDIHGFRAGKTRDERRAEYRGRTDAPKRGPQPAITDEEWHKVLPSGASIDDIATQLGVSEWTVRQARKRLGYHHTVQELKVRDRAFKALFESGYTVQQAADRMSTSRQAADHVRRRLVTEGAEFPETRGGARGRSPIERERA